MSPRARFFLRTRTHVEAWRRVFPDDLEQHSFGDWWLRGMACELLDTRA